MYKNNRSNNRSNSRFSKPSLNATNYETRNKFDVTMPTPEASPSSESGFNFLAFRNLQNTGSIETKVDIYSELTLASYPYNVVAADNRATSVTYLGQSNIMGNTIVRLQNSSEGGLLYLYDTVGVNAQFNYLYGAWTSDQTNSNKPLIVEFVKTVAEATSKAYATLTLDLPFYVDRFVPTGFAITGDDGYVGDTDIGRTAMLIHYEINIQNFISPMSKYIEFRSLEQELKNMSYRREAVIVENLYGMFKKAAYITQLDALGAAMTAQYVDTSWYKHINHFRSIPGRKSNSMLDPLITVTSSHKNFDIKAYIGDSTSEDDVYYDSSQLLSEDLVIMNPDTFMALPSAKYTVEQLAYLYSRCLDASTVLAWARKYTQILLPAGNIVPTASAYYENTNKILRALMQLAAKFVSSMAEVTTFLDKCSNIGLIYWEKGVKFAVPTKIEKIQVTRNMLLEDYIKSYLASSSDVKYNVNTQRWATYAIWDKYVGIPRFDVLNGGSFLTFSTKTISTIDSAGNDMDEFSTQFLLPLLFTQKNVSYNNQFDPPVVIGDRTGNTTTVTRLVIPTTDVLADYVYAGLDPLSTGFDITVPLIKWDVSQASPFSLAARVRLCDQFFKLGRVETNQDGTQYSDNMSSDLIAAINFEIYDMTNAMITFSRNYSPFRVSTPLAKKLVGFE